MALREDHEKVGYWTREQVEKMDNRALAKLVSVHPLMVPAGLKRALTLFHRRATAIPPDFSPEQADTILAGLFSALPTVLNAGSENLSAAQRIMREVAEKYLIEVSDLTDPSRSRGIANRARQDAAFRLRSELGLPLSTIGRLLKRDHTTILHALRREEERRAPA